MDDGTNAGEEDHARPGWTTSRRGQDSLWKSQSKRQRTEINGESTSMVWPTLGSRTAKEQEQTERSITVLESTATFIIIIIIIIAINGLLAAGDLPCVP